MGPHLATQKVGKAPDRVKIEELWRVTLDGWGTGLGVGRSRLFLRDQGGALFCRELVHSKRKVMPCCT